MQFTLIILWAKRPTCSQKDLRIQFLEGGRDRGHLWGRSPRLLRAQPAPFFSPSCLHLQARAAPLLVHCHQCCHYTSAGVLNPCASFVRGELVDVPGCLLQAPSHPDQVWSHLLVASSGRQEKLGSLDPVCCSSTFFQEGCRVKWKHCAWCLWEWLSKPRDSFKASASQTSKSL